MTNIELHIAMTCFILLLVAGVAFFANKDQLTRKKADRVISGKTIGTKNNSLLVENIYFKKSKSLALLAFMLSLGILFSSDFTLGTLNSKGSPLTLPGLFFQVLFALLPFVFAIHRIIYRVVVVKDGIVIKSFFTDKILFSDIVNLKVKSFKGSTYLEINLKSGKIKTIGFDLVGINDFIEILSCKTKRANTI